MTGKTKPKTAKGRANARVARNRASPEFADPERPISSKESGDLVARIREVIGDESVSSFGRRSCVPEANLRSYINDGRVPPLDIATKIANAGGVLVDWLATGRPPKTRAELKPLAAPPINVGALAAIIAAVDFTNPSAGPAERAATAAKAYAASIASDEITPTGPGAKAPKTAA